MEYARQPIDVQQQTKYYCYYYYHFIRNWKNLHSSAKNLQSILYQLKIRIIIKKLNNANNNNSNNKQQQQTNNYSNKVMFNKH